MRKETKLETMQLRDQSGQRMYLTPSERKHFRRKLSQLDAHKRIFCEVLYYTGCRLLEAHQLDASRFDLSDGSLIFETLKLRRRGVYRAVPVPREWLQSSYDLLCADSQNSMIWGFSKKTAYRAVKKVMQSAGIEGAHACPKGLRHGYGIAHGQNKTNPRLIQRWMGHTSLDTTMIYLDAQGQEARDAAKVVW